MLVSKLLSSRTNNRPLASPRLSMTPNIIDTDSNPSSHESTPDVHPSLVEYLSMFPIDYSNANPQPPTSYVSPELSAPSFSPQGHVPSSEFSKLPLPWEPSTSTFTQSLNKPHNYSSNPSPFTINQSLPSNPTPQYSNFTMKSDFPESNLADLGMMLTGDSGMDEQWMSFMRDSGLLEGNMNNSGLYSGTISSL